MRRLLTVMQDHQQIFIINLRKLRDDPTIIFNQEGSGNFCINDHCYIILVSSIIDQDL